MSRQIDSLSSPPAYNTSSLPYELPPRHLWTPAPYPGLDRQGGSPRRGPDHPERSRLSASTRPDADILARQANEFEAAYVALNPQTRPDRNVAARTAAWLCRTARCGDSRWRAHGSSVSLPSRHVGARKPKPASPSRQGTPSTAATGWYPAEIPSTPVTRSTGDSSAGGTGTLRRLEGSCDPLWGPFSRREGAAGRGPEDELKHPIGGWTQITIYSEPG